jgi:hypothetical protein
VRIGNRLAACCLAVVAVLAIDSGCTSARHGVQRLSASHLADTATSYNLAIEQTQDEMLLLNVIRAQDNYPLYLTDAAKVTGTVKAEFNLGLKIPLVHAGSANANDYFGMPTVDYSSSPSMDVILLNTKDFMTGFLTPIGTDLFAYYWDQGWPAEFLLYLLVLRVDEYDEKHNLVAGHSLINFPNSDDPSFGELRRFSRWVREQLRYGRPLLCSEEGAAVGPPFKANSLKYLEFLVPVAKEGLSLVPADGTLPQPTAGAWQLRQPKKSFFLTPRKNPDDAEPAACTKESEQFEVATRAAQSQPARSQKTVGVAGPGKHKYELSLRSPEGVLYYLGELARLENRAGRALLIYQCDERAQCLDANRQPLTEPLFVALDRHEHGACRPIVWVHSLDGKDYLIPNGNEMKKVTANNDDLQLAAASGLCATGETMHALELLSQLIGLQKAAKDLDTTSTVKVVGQ